MQSRPFVDASHPVHAPATPAWEAPPPRAEESPDPHDPRRLLAARLIEGQLVRLGRANAVIERRLGQALAAMAAGHSYRTLGFVRLADYVTERLGISLRRTQVLVRTERALRRLPSVARAFDSGSLPPTKLRVISAVATEDTQELWLSRARDLTVRRLEDLARAAREGTDAAAGPPPGTGGDAHTGAGGEADADVEEPGALISFAAPGPVVARWHWALDLVRRVAGHQEPPWRCAEYLAAEFLSGVPDAEDSTHAGDPPMDAPASRSEISAGPHSGIPAGPSPDTRPALPETARAAAGRRRSGEETWLQATEAVRDALRSLGSGADPEAILAGDPEHGDPADADPWDLDTRMRGLVRLRQSLAWRRGRLLRSFWSLELHRDLGFSSAADWCQEAIGMSPRRARYLASLDRRLRPLPLLADAYRRGLVSWCQARLLVRVAREGTEGRWVRYARHVTVRRLEEVVASCEIDDALGEGAPHAAVPLPPEEPVPPAEEDRATHDTPVGRWHTCAPHDVRHRIAFWAPLGVVTLWQSALRACRGAAGRPLREWECLELFIESMRATWENPGDPGWRRRHRIFERDGWRCRVPGCTSRRNLNEHHIVFRSQGGEDGDSNLVTLCVGHHQQGIHEGRVRCSGRAPGQLWWELGTRTGGPPLVRLFNERIVGAGESPARVALRVAPAAVGSARNPGQ